MGTHLARAVKERSHEIRPDGGFVWIDALIPNNAWEYRLRLALDSAQPVLVVVAGLSSGKVEFIEIALDALIPWDASANVLPVLVNVKPTAAVAEVVEIPT